MVSIPSSDAAQMRFGGTECCNAAIDVVELVKKGSDVLSFGKFCRFAFQATKPFWSKWFHGLDFGSGGGLVNPPKVVEATSLTASEAVAAAPRSHRLVTDVAFKSDQGSN